MHIKVYFIDYVSMKGDLIIMLERDLSLFKSSILEQGLRKFCLSLKGLSTSVNFCNFYDRSISLILNTKIVTWGFSLVYIIFQNRFTWLLLSNNNLLQRVKLLQLSIKRDLKFVNGCSVFSVNIPRSSFAAAHLTRSLECVGVFLMNHSMSFS